MKKALAALVIAVVAVLPGCRSGVDRGPENDPNRRGYAFMARRGAVAVYGDSNGPAVVDSVDPSRPMIAWRGRPAPTVRTSVGGALREENGRYQVRYWKGWTIESPVAEETVIGWVSREDVRAVEFDCCGDRHCEGVSLEYRPDPYWNVEKPTAFHSCFVEAWRKAGSR